MSGELELVARGIEDKHLIGNPQISFFKVVYKRHTNFSMESIPLDIISSISNGDEVKVDIKRNGDLLYNCWLEIELNTISSNTYISSLSVLDKIEFLIDDNIIDKHSYRYLHSSYNTNYNYDELNNLESQVYLNDTTSNQKIKIPLQFWFCKNIGQVLPLISLQNSKLQFNIKISNSLYISNNSLDYNIHSLKVWCNYIFLDNDERKKFAYNKQSYLIQLVQENIKSLNSNNGNNEVTSNIELDLYHPTKYFIWYLGLDSPTEIGNSTHKNNIYMTKAQLKLEGHDRFEEQDYNYFKHYQFLQNKQTNYINNNIYKSINLLSNLSFCQTNENLIQNRYSPLYYMYSFALNPKEYQPSGTCNFSKFKNVEFIIKHKSPNSSNTTTSTLHLFAIHYNILNIENGIGNLLYSN